MPKKLSKQNHIDPSTNANKNNDSNISELTYQQQSAIMAGITQDNYDWEFIDDDYTDPSELLKLPQYTFNKIDNPSSLKGILRNPKKLYKEKSVSFKKGDIDKINLEECHTQMDIHLQELVKFKSIFKTSSNNNPNSIEQEETKKKYKKDVKKTYKDIYKWSTRAENVSTQTWSFPQEDINERIRTQEEKVKYSKKERQVLERKVGIETKLRVSGLQLEKVKQQIEDMKHEIESVELKIAKEKIFSPKKKLLLTIKVKNKKTLDILMLMQENISTNIDILKNSRQTHMHKNPSYYA